MNMNQPVVWVVDSDHWPRAELRALLIERGYDAIGFETLLDAVTGPGRTARPPAVIVIDLAAQGSADVACAALLAERIAVIAVGGAVAAEDEWLRGRPWAEFLRRPVTLGEIADAVARVAPGS